MILVYYNTAPDGTFWNLPFAFFFLHALAFPSGSGVCFWSNVLPPEIPAAEYKRIT